LATILVIDDNETIREGLAHVVKKMGHLPLVAKSGKEGLERFKQTPADFVITDLKMEGLDGVEVLRSVRELDPDCPAMIITAFGTIETAVEAMKLGAFDFLIKPFAPEVVRLKVERALELRAARRAKGRLEAENAYLRGEESSRFGELVGSSEPMRKVFAVVERVAPTDTSVAIYGESGTGKELVARALHRHSPRAARAFIAINTAAIPKDLLESELFGHERGAFTGAQAMRRGRFEQAEGGTLFLDEIGDMPPELQTRLLRVLSDGQFYRVGGHTPLSANVRVIAATHQDLEARVKQGLFREDLYHRLNVIRLRLPALRERRDDIPMLARHFLAKSARELGVDGKRLTEEATRFFAAQEWPGNVRQLENICHWVTVMAPGQVVDVKDLPPEVRGEASAAAGAEHDWRRVLEREVAARLARGESGIADPLTREFETVLILKALQHTGGRRIEAAGLLGIGRNTLTRKVQELKIDVKD